MLRWKWVRGESCLKSLTELLQEPLLIPQPNVIDAPISLNLVDKPEKKLGVYVCPMGDFKYHVDQIKQMEMEYASRLQSCNPPPQDSWMGTRYQLCPKMIHDTVTLTHNPEKLEDTFQTMWYNLLPSLCINRHIRKNSALSLYNSRGLLSPTLISTHSVQKYT